MRKIIDNFILKYATYIMETIKSNEYIVISSYDDVIASDIINFEFMEQINGLSRDRKCVYLNYLDSVNETNTTFSYKIYNNLKSIYLIIDVDFSIGEPVIIACKNIDIMSKIIKFREVFLIDIYDEFKIFNQKIEEFELKNNINPGTLNLTAKVLKNVEQKEKYYTFNIYNDSKLIAKDLSNIYNLDLDKLIG